ncbi:MAG: hypothetical protein JWN32_4524, partial [Solirubrobacterales bacterium]|nr:hypothetical protein [Solirubrobacterales bacterium]
ARAEPARAETERADDRAPAVAAA